MPTQPQGKNHPPSLHSCPFPFGPGCSQKLQLDAHESQAHFWKQPKSIRGAGFQSPFTFSANNSGHVGGQKTGKNLLQRSKSSKKSMNHGMSTGGVLVKPPVGISVELRLRPSEASLVTHGRGLVGSCWFTDTITSRLSHSWICENSMLFALFSAWASMRALVKFENGHRTISDH